jgi:hypothetical protein
MTNRELFLNIMNYGVFDRMPVVHWSAWPETMERWYGEGLPRDGDLHAFLGTRPHWTSVGADVGLFPKFEEETYEETAVYRVFRDQNGVVCKAWKHQSNIPHYMDFTLKTGKDWPLYRRRLQPDPARLPADLDQRIANATASGLPIACGPARSWAGSATGWGWKTWPISRSTSATCSARWS